jgi:hypothetical protein
MATSAYRLVMGRSHFRRLLLRRASAGNALSCSLIAQSAVGGLILVAEIRNPTNTTYRNLKATVSHFFAWIVKLMRRCDWTCLIFETRSITEVSVLNATCISEGCKMCPARFSAKSYGVWFCAACVGQFTFANNVTVAKISLPKGSPRITLPSIGSRRE